MLQVAQQHDTVMPAALGIVKVLEHTVSGKTKLHLKAETMVDDTVVLVEMAHR